MQKASEGVAWLDVLPNSQYGTELYREKFRDALWWLLDITILVPYLV